MTELNAPTVAAGVTSLYLADLEAGRVQSLAAYQALYPGWESLVEEEIERLRRSTPHISRERDTSEALPESSEWGPFRILEEIGRGGQAVVYRAADTRSSRTVALKILPLSGLVREAAAARFRREATIMSLLEDPALCPVIEAGTIGDVPFLSMPYFPGETLARTLERDRHALGSDIDGVVGLGETLARAIHRAHESGIIHRDIKPANIMRTDDGRPVLLDFGLARLVDDDATGVTRTGELFGTPDYMSPEQVTRQSIPLDRRTDVYSLGAVLFECLTGRSPFRASTRVALYQAILTHPVPDPRRYNPLITRPLADVLVTALEKDRDRRYDTAAELADDLARARARRSVRARPPGPILSLRRWVAARPRMAPAVIGGVVAMATLMVAFLVAWRVARDDLARYRLLTDTEVLRRLDTWGDRLWQPLSELDGDDMAAWIAEARGLVDRLPEYEAARDGLREGGEPDGHGARPLADPDDSFRERTLTALIEGAKRLPPRIEEMRARRAFALSVRRRSLEDFRTRWDEIRRDIADESLNPQYRGLDVPPQLGLVPLGRNDESGLYEFLALAWFTDVGRSLADLDAGREPIAPVMILIPGGTARLGSSGEADPQAAARETRHERKLAPFFLARTEVTQRLWLRAMLDNPSTGAPGRLEPEATTTLDHPVESVTWRDAMELARRLGLALPTEAQWEYACRAGTETPYFFGEWSDLRDEVNVADASLESSGLAYVSGEIAPWSDDFPCHAPVRTFEPNSWGLSEMHGNVSEWCRDLYHRDWHVFDAGRPDGSSSIERGTSRVYRGGSWYVGYRNSRSAMRWKDRETVARPDLGVRLARALLREE